MPPLLLAALAFVAMEPVAYLAHRRVMHGRGRAAAWHVPHHQDGARSGRFDANDRYPAVMAALTVALMAAGTWVDGWSALVWIGAGITAYGAAYLFVHDLYIHRRIAGFTWVWGPLERVREAHRIHHLWGGEPYGFLFPVVPAELRSRARTVTRDPLSSARSERRGAATPRGA
jgi:beta-carotene 3-hydroxylase